jgi:hypothetical protein
MGALPRAGMEDASHIAEIIDLHHHAQLVCLEGILLIFFAWDGLEPQSSQSPPPK